MQFRDLRADYFDNMLRATDIVVRRGIAKSHVSLSVSSLEERGLLARHVDAHDRRAVHLSLSEQAKSIAQTGQAAQTGFFKQLYAGLTQEEVAQWQRIFTKVSNNIAQMEL